VVRGAAIVGTDGSVGTIPPFLIPQMLIAAPPIQ
jgi:hypothetical protein